MFVGIVLGLVVLVEVVVWCRVWWLGNIVLFGLVGVWCCVLGWCLVCYLLCFRLVVVVELMIVVRLVR